MPYVKTKDGTRLYYEDRAAKNPGYAPDETLLVIHGLGSSHYDLIKFIENLNQKHRVVFYDQRNHGDSDHARFHLDVQTLGQDLHDVIDQLQLEDVTIIGHSMGAAAVFSYIGQFGDSKLKRFGIADMSPYMRNHGWKGGIGRGEWTDKDFMEDFDRLFHDVGYGSWYIMSHLMNPNFLKLSEVEQQKIIDQSRDAVDALAFPAFWYSLYRTDQRPAVEKITVPVLYLMPELPLYSTVDTDFLKSHVKGGFTLEKDFPDTTHLILSEDPDGTAKAVDAFIEETR